MASVNRVILIGNIGKEPEVRLLQDGTQNTTLTLATSERYKNRDGEPQERTEWHTIICWQNIADFAGKYIKKGDLVYVEGKIRSRSWEDQNGQRRYVTEIHADNIKNLTKRDVQDRPERTAYQPQEQPRPQQTRRSRAADLFDPEESDLPFESRPRHAAKLPTMKNR